MQRKPVPTDVVFICFFCCSKDEQKGLGFFPSVPVILTWTRFLEHFLGDSGISSWEGVQPKRLVHIHGFLDGEFPMFLPAFIQLGSAKILDRFCCGANENRRTHPLRWRTRITASPESRKDANLGYLLRFDPQTPIDTPKVSPPTYL